jgi:para-aminobenzoate synthetase component 1
MRATPLPYRPDSADLFEAIACEPWSVFLDSGRPAIDSGRWDIFAARPYATLTTSQSGTRIETRAGQRIKTGDPLDLLRAHLGRPQPRSGTLPFSGGAIGYFAYDLASRLGLPARTADHVPSMAVGLYDWAVVVDHQERRATLVGADRDPRTARDWDGLIELFREPCEPIGGDRSAGPAPVSNLTPDAYRRAFDRVMAYIQAGDCYQINLTQRYSSRFQGDRWSLYRALRRINPAPFAAYLNQPSLQILSSSPERFIELRGDLVSTCPIKGTRPRGADPAADRALAEELAASSKDRAENLMIVDLLRNDLGKVCRTGSVAVPDLFAVQSFANVHHLVSTVRGRLRHDADALDLMRATFPGGSITGAPKRRAMEIIAELEPDPRGVYCGAIGYIGFDGDMDTSIAIRTLVANGDEISFGVGGGIVADSTPESEYRECLDKAAPMLSLLSATR